MDEVFRIAEKLKDEKVYPLLVKSIERFYTTTVSGQAYSDRCYLMGIMTVYLVNGFISHDEYNIFFSHIIESGNNRFWNKPKEED